MNESEDDSKEHLLEAAIDVVDGEDRAARMKLRRGITMDSGGHHIAMDSGTHHNVMPRRMARGKIRPPEGSKRVMKYTAANRGTIANEGETDFEFVTMEGMQQSWNFQIAEVNKALGAVSDRVDNSSR